MACEQPVKVSMGDDLVLTLTFRTESDEELMNLDTDVSAIELEIKAADGDADPALVSLSIGSGIVLLAQSGDTLGQAAATVPAASNTALGAGVKRYDVVAVLTGGTRHHAVNPSDYEVLAVVNGTA